MTVKTTGAPPASVVLRPDERLADFRRPVTVEVNGTVTTRILRPSLATLCRTTPERGDPDLACSVLVPLAP